MCPSDLVLNLTTSVPGQDAATRPLSEADSPSCFPSALFDRLTELRCPVFLRDAIRGGAFRCTWEIPYRGARSVPKYAWAVYHVLGNDSNLDSVVLTVEALEFGLSVSRTGALVRARMGNRYLSAPERLPLYETLLHDFV